MPTPRPLWSALNVSRAGFLRIRHAGSSGIYQTRNCSCNNADSAKPQAQQQSAEARKTKYPKSTVDAERRMRVTLDTALQQLKKDPSTPPPDHRDLGVAQGLFTTSSYSPGSPLFLPNGTDMLNKLGAFLRAQYPHYGFREVITPTIYKKSLWEKSGHWENYAEDMYEVAGRGATGTKEGEIGEDEAYGLKPMNCPGHCILFASKRRSWRDLPIRFADFSALHRNEISGALSGLTRVRRFHQDDAHIFCTPQQIGSEIAKQLEFLDMVYRVFDFSSYKLVLSTRPEKHYIGTEEDWKDAEDQLIQALDASNSKWELNPGDGAFYGPKIDVILTDSHGKEHQTATIQLDFQLPKRFDLKYDAPHSDTDAKPDSSPEGQLNKSNPTGTPVMIHRAILGSLERFLALLIEHYNGKYPFWLSPRPCIVLAVADTPTILSYVETVQKTLSQSSAVLPARIGRPVTNVDVDVSPNSLKKKVRDAKVKGYNFIVVVGQRDVEEEWVTMEGCNQRAVEMLMDNEFGRIDNKSVERLGPAKWRMKTKKAGEFFRVLQDSFL